MLIRAGLPRFNITSTQVETGVLHQPVVAATQPIFSFSNKLVHMQELADIILHGGRVLTVDRNDTIQEALAIVGDKIVAVGTNGSIRAMAGPRTTNFDLQGRTVIPGIIDIHQASAM